MGGQQKKTAKAALSRHQRACAKNMGYSHAPSTQEVYICLWVLSFFLVSFSVSSFGIMAKGCQTWAGV
jgi:hypothetical protein